MKYFFPVHLNGGNRGCEGIAKGTSLILKKKKNDLIGLCTDTRLDHKLGIDEYVSLFPARKATIYDRLLFHIYPPYLKNYRLKQQDYHFLYDRFLSLIGDNDLMLVTGGDMLCYEDNYISYINNKLHNRGVKTVLWGCSMGPENMTPMKEETLHNFSMIYVRESLTQEYFKSLRLCNIHCFPDPAFVLSPQETTLPKIFLNGDVVGLNLSNYVLGDYSLDTPFGKQIRRFINYILEEEKMQILLIPHVTWGDQDDRKVANIVKSYYSSDERVGILDISKLNYCQIRYIISKCKFFVGGRTHAVISAYSTCVPTLALGYSIKSKGIAKDLDLSDKLVVNCKKINTGYELMDSFYHLIKNENEIRGQIQKLMPIYCKYPYAVKHIIDDLVV